MVTLAEARAQLEERRSSLAETKQQIAEAEAELLRQQEALGLTREQIEAYQPYIQQTRRELMRAPNTKFLLCRRSCGRPMLFDGVRFYWPG